VSMCPFSIPSGSFFSILGPRVRQNTLLRMLAAFLRPDSAISASRANQMLASHQQGPYDYGVSASGAFPCMSVEDNSPHGPQAAVVPASRGYAPASVMCERGWGVPDVR